MDCLRRLRIWNCNILLKGDLRKSDIRDIAWLKQTPQPKCGGLDIDITDHKSLPIHYFTPYEQKFIQFMNKHNHNFVYKVNGFDYVNHAAVEPVVREINFTN
jgi:hypothetical protein